MARGSQRLVVRGDGTGGTGADAHVYVDLACGSIHIETVGAGQVVLVWGGAEPTLSGTSSYAMWEILPTMWAIDITAPGSLDITTGDSGPIVAQVFRFGEATFTSCA